MNDSYESKKLNMTNTCKIFFINKVVDKK